MKEIKCPKCGNTYPDVDAKQAGTVGSCPDCDEVVRWESYDRSKIKQFKYPCPHCGDSLNVTTEQVGKIRHCGECERSSIVPSAPENIDNDGCPLEAAKMVLILGLIVWLISMAT